MGTDKSPEKHPDKPGPGNKKPIGGPHSIIFYEGKSFGVWFHPSGRLREVSLLYQKNIIPDEQYRKHHDIEHRYVEKDGVKFVVYIENGKILGSEYATKTHVANGSEINIRKSNKRLPRKKDCPDRTFMYQNREVGVWNDYTGKPKSVGLVSTNIIPTEEDREKYNIYTSIEHQDGVYFLVHELLPSKNILGVELIR